MYVAARNGCRTLTEPATISRVIAGLDNPLHIVIVVVVLLLVFGPKRLPELGRSLGSGIRAFKDGVTSAGEPDPLPPATPATSDTRPDRDRP